MSDPDPFPALDKFFASLSEFDKSWSRRMTNFGTVICDHCENKFTFFWYLDCVLCWYGNLSNNWNACLLLRTRILCDQCFNILEVKYENFRNQV